MHVRLLLSGLNGKNTCSIQYKANLDDKYTTLKTIREDGILEVDVPESAITVLYFYIYDKENTDAITIAQLPLYPGALVSDGVDDGGITSEVLGDTEQVGSILAMAKFYGTPTNNEYLFFAGLTESNIAILRSADDRIYGRIGSQNQKEIVSSNGVFTLSDSPVIANRNFLINYSGMTNYCHSILSRLILIKEQLDDAQLEFLTWKVGKEYRDWCKENGYDYAIPEMTENATN